MRVVVVWGFGLDLGRISSSTWARCSSQMVDEVLALIEEVQSNETAMAPGSVYCYFNESAEAAGCRPDEPRKVFDGYGSTGRPKFTDFVTMAIERKAKGIEGLVGGEDVTLTHVTQGRILRTAQLQEFGDSIDVNVVMQGLRDSLDGAESAVSQDDFRASMERLRAQAQEENLAANASEGEAFLTANAEREGVVVLPSGLQYEVLTIGDGPKPSAEDKVTTHYTGTLITGEVFDSSVERGEPATFPLNGVIPGWTEALQLMPVGSKWRLFVPPELAYGDRAVGGVITPGSTLIFEVELLEIAD